MAAWSLGPPVPWPRHSAHVAQELLLITDRLLSGDVRGVMHMGSTAGQLRQILERELAIHRELLRLARSRHLLLKQGRFDEAADLAVLETPHIFTLRELEAKTRQLCHQTSPTRPDVAPVTRQNPTPG